MRNIGLTILTLTALGASGCVVTSVDPYYQAVYESCGFVSDCDANADFCQRIVTDWPDGISSENSICTYGCFDDFDCISSTSGNPGICEDLGRGTGFLCYEACDFDSDCDIGFACEGICLPR